MSPDTQNILSAIVTFLLLLVVPFGDPRKKHGHFQLIFVFSRFLKKIIQKHKKNVYS